MTSANYVVLLTNASLPPTVELYSSQRLAREVSEIQHCTPLLFAARRGKFSKYLREDFVVGFCNWLLRIQLTNFGSMLYTVYTLLVTSCVPTMIMHYIRIFT
jgi:hypothetical protein